MSHLQDAHGIRRVDGGFERYLRAHFDCPNCACGCGTPTPLSRRKWEFLLFAADCPKKNRFINPKFPEFYLFAGKTVAEAIAGVRDHQSKLAVRAATPAHKQNLAVRNSGSRNPSSVQSTMARTGMTEGEVRAEARQRSAAPRNGFYGKKHTAETKRHLARVRANQPRVVTKPELAIWGMLHALGISFGFQEPIDVYVVDFLIGRTVVEVFGDYWHGDKISPSKRLGDGTKLARLEELGYGVVVLKESDIFRHTAEVVKRLKALGICE